MYADIELDLHCLQRQGISGFSRTRVKHTTVIKDKHTIVIKHALVISLRRVCVFHHSLFTFPTGIICKSCPVIVTLPGKL